MATYTENYDLTLPETEDYFDIADYNSNLETIDTLMAENESVVKEVNEKLGTPNENETVFSLLRTGSSIIKSIQHVTYTKGSSVGSGTVEIDAVDTTKCIVILERLHDTDTMSKVIYTLNESSIDITHKDSTVPDNLTLGFWIIEFN